LGDRELDNLGAGRGLRRLLAHAHKYAPWFGREQDAGRFCRETDLTGTSGLLRTAHSSECYQRMTGDSSKDILVPAGPVLTWSPVSILSP
jgi:hypothetical protein